MALSKERQALLKQKGDNYIATMEAAGSGVNYTRVSTDRLLILEALNDWSGRLLAEGDDIKLTHGCDDPACASKFELSELVTRMHAAPMILYPVSGFGLSDKDDLRFGHESSSFRMTPHTSGSRADAISIAESNHIRDVDAAMNLWALCATEDCLAYLRYQMDEHGLAFGEEEFVAARQIITSALLTNFSAGQVWNAIWRSVKDAAALSTRQYYNVLKASKTIPKKIDKVLTQNANTRAGFPAYDRLAAFPMGAVLSLLLSRFGIEDDAPGPEVRAKFAADAALAPPAPGDEVEEDNSRALVRGTMFFIKDVTPMDRMVLSCLRNLRTDTPEPEWDENHVVGRLDFSLNDIYAFDGSAFLRLFLAASGVPEPTQEDLARHAAAAQAHKDNTGEWVDLSGWAGAIGEALIKAGINPVRLGLISYVVRYPATFDDIMGMMQALPGERGLQAIRADYVHLYDEFFERSDGLYAGGYSFHFPEDRLEPDGCDTDLVLAIAGKNIDRLAEMVTTSVLRSVSCINDELKGQLLQRAGQRLVALTTPPSQDEEGADLRHPGDPH